ncbi:hypothetical protein HELRODRAFT_167963 [Helobdella robusta]|uniref:Uncharacterized protein n=1 Tax=Helobdella robusta TaxID=6412 RepID=T1F004_HELRO|nr:hypothetical protein HELRODRAFT_167963 [Helobdella robusta]ESO10104.1 hypothetical protein HELRODRAFT_167963 [Helobdella robusta]
MTDGMGTGASQQLPTLRGSLESGKSAIVDAVESRKSQTDHDHGKKYVGIYRKKNNRHARLSCSGKNGKCYLSCDSDCKSKDSSCSSKNKSSTSCDASSATSYDLTKLIESLGKPLFLKFKQKEADCDTDGTTEEKSSI